MAISVLPCGTVANVLPGDTVAKVLPGGTVANGDQDSVSHAVVIEPGDCHIGLFEIFKRHKT